MKGRITAINRLNGFHAVLTEEDVVCVFEVIDSHEPEIGDLVSGRLDCEGSEKLHNETQGESFDVVVQWAHCTREEAALRLKR